MKLAQQLVIRAKANPDYPIPVLLNLSSWKAETQSIKDWMVTDLKAKYGVRKDIAKQWIEEEKIIPLLDGLDELDAARQEKCVQAINEFLHPETWSRGLVVCSRLEEYQHYQTNLGLKGSIILKPLTIEEIKDYILKTEGESLWNTIKTDSDFIELAKTPLFLNIIIIASQNIYFEQWKQLPSSEERQNHLFDAYIQRMLKRPYKKKPKPYKDEDTKRWLGYLAKQLIRENKTEFLIEKMQPTWLENPSKEISYGMIVGLIYWLIVGLSVGLILMLIYWLIVELIPGQATGLLIALVSLQIVGLISWLTVGLMIALIFGLFVGEAPIKAVEAFQFSFKNLKNNLIFGLICGFILEITLGKMSGVILGIAGLINGLIDGLISWLIGSKIEYKNTPNQWISQSLQKIFIVTTLTSVSCVGLSWLLMLALEESISVFYASIVCFGLSLLLGLLKKGLPLIQHFSLRLVLSKNYHIPWNYARFLDYSTNRLFLQRVGGGYRFVHDLLRQHFAEKY